MTYSAQLCTNIFWSRRLWIVDGALKVYLADGLWRVKAYCCKWRRLQPLFLSIWYPPVKLGTGMVVSPIIMSAGQSFHWLQDLHDELLVALEQETNRLAAEGGSIAVFEMDKVGDGWRWEMGRVSRVCLQSYMKWNHVIWSMSQWEQNYNMLYCKFMSRNTCSIL